MTAAGQVCIGGWKNNVHCIKREKCRTARGSNWIQQLLTQYHLENRIVVVELNKEIVLKEHYETTNHRGDMVEIIHFVGGG